jgi:hypothetical protein
MVALNSPERTRRGPRSAGVTAGRRRHFIRTVARFLLSCHRPSPVQDVPGGGAKSSGATDVSGTRDADDARASGPGGAGGAVGPDAYDWTQAEDELHDVLPAMFVGETGSVSAGVDEARA